MDIIAGFMSPPGDLVHVLAGAKEVWGATAPTFVCKAKRKI